MRSFFLFILLFSTFISIGQTIPKVSTDYTISKQESKPFYFSLLKGHILKSTVLQKGIDVEVFIHRLKDTTRLFYMDSPNGTEGPEPIEFESPATGDYVLVIKTLLQNEAASGIFSINIDTILTPYDVIKVKENRQQEEGEFIQWITKQSKVITAIDPGNGSIDLQVFKPILMDVQLIGLGESTHGTSEFFRMKHRLLEFLVVDMGYRSFYIEASMSRCRYINDYILFGRGNLDTATAIQGFVTWRVEEFRNMIDWMRKYNSRVQESDQVHFYGYDLQVNDYALRELKSFYRRVNPAEASTIDTIEIRMMRASYFSNQAADSLQQKGKSLFQSLSTQVIAVLKDFTLNAGKYQSLTHSTHYYRNWENIRLILQEIESYKDGYNDRRDYYMAENILNLYQQERPGTKVVVWAHNGHIAKISSAGYKNMGHWLNQTLGKKYYALGFEFYSGSFQTRNRDSTNWSWDWDIMSVGDPTIGSLPWHLHQTGKENLFLDFRSTNAEKVKLFHRPILMHSLGSMYSWQWASMQSTRLNAYDGILYIKNSTAAKNFKKVYR